jgi:hypothetical protein
LPGYHRAIYVCSIVLLRNLRLPFDKFLLQFIPDNVRFVHIILADCVIAAIFVMYSDEYLLSGRQ